MREALSKRPKTASKPKTKVAENRAKAKPRLTPKAKNLSASKTVARSTAKAKVAASKATAKKANKAKPTSKAPTRKKAAVKTAKATSKRAVKAAPKSATKKVLTAKKSPKLSASAARAKVKETKTRAKAPAKTRAKAPAPAKSSKTVSKSVGKTTGKTTPKVRQTKVASKTRRKVVLPPIKVAPPEPPRRIVPSGALRAFEHAVKVFNRRHFEDAKIMFENLLAKFPAEAEIIARAQMYLQVCNQKLSHTQITPRNADELYDRGVYALNLGDFSQAKNFFEKALRLKPDEPHLLYSLAATHAQTGAMDQALDYLQRTIQLQPRYRTQALNDSDFSGLRENKQFLELLGLASPFDLLSFRR